MIWQREKRSKIYKRNKTQQLMRLAYKKQKAAFRRLKACGEYRSRTGDLLHAMQAL